MTKKWKVVLRHKENGKKVKRTVETQGERSGLAELCGVLKKEMEKNGTLGQWDMTDMKLVGRG